MEDDAKIFMQDLQEQHKKLLEAGSDLENSSAGAADAPPAKVAAGRTVTGSAWTCSTRPRS